MGPSWGQCRNYTKHTPPAQCEGGVWRVKTRLARPGNEHYMLVGFYQNRRLNCTAFELWAPIGNPISCHATHPLYSNPTALTSENILSYLNQIGESFPINLPPLQYICLVQNPCWAGLMRGICNLSVGCWRLYRRIGFEPRECLTQDGCSVYLRVKVVGSTVQTTLWKWQVRCLIIYWCIVPIIIRYELLLYDFSYSASPRASRSRSRKRLSLQ